jgi:hypothetical protein
MAIRPVGSGSHQVLHPTGVGVGVIFHPLIFPKLAGVFLGADFKLQLWVTWWAPKIIQM